jgi:hypothetical protein
MPVAAQDQTALVHGQSACQPRAAGVTGGAGAQGPQGPGAISFHSTLPAENASGTIATTPKGLKVEGLCFVGGTNVETILITTDESERFQGSGTETRETKTILPVEVNEDSTGAGADSAKAADFDLVARDTRFDKIVHVIAHGTAGKPCTFWGMIIPSG